MGIIQQLEDNTKLGSSNLTAMVNVCEWPELKNMTVSDFEENLQWIYWEDNLSDFETEQRISKVDLLKHVKIKFMLVKNINLWNIMEIWHVKLRNCMSHNDATPDEGVDNFKVIYNDGEAMRAVQAMKMMFRPDGSFFLVIYLNNDKSDDIRFFNKIIWK